MGSMYCEVHARSMPELIRRLRQAMHLPPNWPIGLSISLKIQNEPDASSGGGQSHSQSQSQALAGGQAGTDADADADADADEAVVGGVVTRVSRFGWVRLTSVEQLSAPPVAAL